MARVLLLNPPAAGLVLRDSWCSKRSKSGYLYHPVDLLVQNGLLARRGVGSALLDAVAERLSAGETLARIGRARPDLVYALAARANLAEDLAFLRRVAALGFPLVVGGDIAPRACRELFTLIPGAAGFLADFSSAALADLLTGDAPSAALLRPGDAGPAVPEPAGETPLGVPDWRTIPRDRYAYPFARRRHPATVLTAVGCGLGCAYCTSGDFPWRPRPLDEVATELALLSELRVRELYFADQTFNRDPARTEELLDRMARFRPLFGFSAFVRLDRLADRLLDRLRAAGCHTLIAGIESARPATRSRHGKPLPDELLADRIAAVRARGIRIAGTFILGLPGEASGAARAAVELAVALSLDFASFNAFVPRAGTPYASGALPAPADQTGGADAVGRRIRAANRRFYLRPGYLARRLLGLRTLDQICIELAQARGLFL